LFFELFAFSRAEGIPHLSDGKITSKIKFHCSSLQFAARRTRCLADEYHQHCGICNFYSFAVTLDENSLTFLFPAKNIQKEKHQPSIVLHTKNNTGK